MTRTDIFRDLCVEATKKYPEIRLCEAKDYRDVLACAGRGTEPGLQSEAAVGNWLYESIRRVIESKTAENENLRPIESQIAIDGLEKRYDVAMYDVIATIRDATLRTNVVNLEKRDCWMEAIRFAMLHKRLTRGNLSLHCSSREHAIVSTLATLRKHRLVAKALDGSISIDDKNIISLAAMIEETVRQIGGLNVINSILHNLEPAYDSTYERFLVGRNSDISGLRLVEPQIPYGYLIALSMKYLKRRGPGEIGLLESLADLAKAYVQVLDIQQFSGYEVLFSGDGVKLIEALEKSVRYDWLVMFPQYPSTDLRKLIRYMVDRFDEPAVHHHLGWALKDYEAVMNAILITTHDVAPTSITTKDLSRDKAVQIEHGAIKRILRLISHNPDKVNAAFHGFEDLPALDHVFKPLVQFNNEHFLICKPITVTGFYESLCTLLRDLKRAGIISVDVDHAMGPLLEDMLHGELEQKGIQCLKNEKYTLSRAMRLELGIQAESGECDIAIESDRCVYFIEIKKKSLRRKSYSGFSREVLLDLSRAFLASQVQLGNHELLLRTYGRIDFDSGKTLYLNGRSVERISLTLLDFWSLQDEIFCKNLFSGLIGHTLKSADDYDTAENRAVLDEINKSLIRLTEQYQSKAYELYRNNHYNYINIRWFSFFQMLVILRNVGSIEDFEKKLKITRHANSLTCNWYRDFIFFERQRSQAQNI
jgi:Holliday junction resolvase-like predicted endonuclease